MVHHNKNILMVLCRSSDQCRPTNINIFNAILKRNGTRGHFVIKRIQIHHNHIKCPYSVLF
uniref:Uncharacterized protein n=1 Tax=Arundo donax TaxID=35708 RepID=A0A0A9EPX8_ARUDO